MCIGLTKFQKSLFSTLHEQAGGGINGKLAQMIKGREYESIISFFESNQCCQPTTTSLNYLIEAYFGRGRHLDAILLAKKFDVLRLLPNTQTFNYLMKGLVAADSTGTLALSVDEIFQLMTRKYGLDPDWQSWLYRIQAFIRPKFMASFDNSVPKLFYGEMSTQIYDKTKLSEIQTELLVTAVNRRVWSFAEHMLWEMRKNNLEDAFLFPAWEEVCLAKGLFSELGCIPELREIQQFSKRLTENHFAASPLSSTALHKNILIFSSKQGRCCADLAFYSLNFLSRKDSKNIQLYSLLAQRTLSRTVPVDLESCPEADAQIPGLLSLAEKLRCPDEYIYKLKSAIKI